MPTQATAGFRWTSLRLPQSEATNTRRGQYRPGIAGY